MSYFGHGYPGKWEMAKAHLFCLIRYHWPLHHKYILKVSTVFDIYASSILMIFILLVFRILLNNLVNFSFVP